MSYHSHVHQNTQLCQDSIQKQAKLSISKIHKTRVLAARLEGPTTGQMPRKVCRSLSALKIHDTRSVSRHISHLWAPMAAGRQSSSIACYKKTHSRLIACSLAA